VAPPGVRVAGDEHAELDRLIGGQRRRLAAFPARRESAHPVDFLREANVVFARLAHGRLGAHRIQAHVEEAGPAYEDLGSSE
jgi:hypothetical protein